jgi:hypothetical protein
MKSFVSLGLTLVFGLAAVVALPATAAAQAPGAASAPSKPGVYAVTDQGTVLLSAFYSGVSTSLPVGFQTNTAAVPKAKTLNAFIVKMPDTDASRVVTYYLNGLTEVWAGGQTPLKQDVKSDNGTLTVTSSEWTGRPPGFAILEIKAGANGIRKFYAVNLGKNFSLGAK